MSRFASNHKIVFFYASTFLISWVAWLLMALVYNGQQPTPQLYVFSTLGGLGPLLALALLQKLTHGELQVKTILAQIKIRGANKGWLLIAIFVLPAIAILGNIGYFLLGQEERFRIIIAGPDELGLLVLPVMLLHFAASLLTSPLFEEPGWRGFALVRLQDKFGRTGGSLIVGLLWWAWHQPMNLTFGLTPSLHSALSMLALSFAIDSLFNLSGKNLLAAMLAHQSSGTVITFLYQGNQNWLQLSLLLLFVVILRLLERTGAQSFDRPAQAAI